MRLQDLFRREGTDKFTHGFADLYECLLSYRRHTIEAVLEVGIGTMIPDAHSSMVDYALPGYKPGGSLRAWRDYFPSATIYGLDVQADTLLPGEERITSVLCDSTSEQQVTTFIEDSPHRTFDLIVDDGSHRPNDQLKTLRNLYPYLAVGGIYIVEDIQGDALRKMGGVSEICGSNPLFFTGPNGCVLVSSRVDSESPGGTVEIAREDGCDA